jgi:anti-sigma28 factor (negative regulator of flagellin synthesis)
MSKKYKYPATPKPKARNKPKASEAEEDCMDGLQRLARDIVYRTPEVRPQKVTRVKEAIEQGTYEVDSKKLSEILTEELLRKR